MNAQKGVTCDKVFGNKVSRGEARGTNNAFFLKNIIKIVVSDLTIDGVEREIIEKLKPTAIEAGDAAGEVVRHRPSATLRSGTFDPVWGIRLHEVKQRRNRRRERILVVVRTDREGGPLSKADVDHIA